MTGNDAESVLAALLASTEDGVIAFDREYRYTVWSPVMEHISGMPASQVIGRVAFEVFPFLVDTGEDACFRAALRGETATTQMQRFFIPQTKREGYFKGIYRPVRSGDEIVGGVGIVRDITTEQVQRSELRMSTERLGLALRAAELGPWEWNAKTDLVDFSERAAEIFGIEPGPVMTWTQMRELLHPADRERARIAVERAVAERTAYDVEYRVVRPNGSEVWVAARGQAVYDDAGTPSHMLGVVQDISARKQVEQALVEETRATQVIEEVGKLIVGELDLHKMLQAVTDAATKLCGAQFGAFFYNATAPSGEIYMLYTLSGVPREAFSQFPMPRNTKVFSPTFNGERIVRSDDITKEPTYGQNAPYHGMPAGHLPVRSYLAVPVQTRDGKIAGGLFFGHEQVGVFTTRHERILGGIASQAAIAIDNARLYEKALASEQEARERADALAKADRHKDDFLAMLAHELRNPLGAISNAVHVMSRCKPGDPAFDRAMQIAGRQIAHQRKLVDDLLDVSRIARGKVLLQRSVYDLATIVRETAEDHRPAFTSAGVRLDVHAGDVSVPIHADRVRIAQVIGNLLDNARKFSRSGGDVELRLEVTANREAVIHVRDTGIGIDATTLAQLFSPFTQAARSIDRSQGGLGLGLALAKGLVELHEGHIEATSAGTDRGTHVRVTLKLADGAVVEASGPTEIAPQRHAHVLVIDDLRDAADTLRELLQLMGCTVDVAYDARQGLAALRARKPDLILCDLGLPGEMDGYGFARAVRSEVGEHVRLVALTGYGAEADQRASREAGFELHLTKPLRPEQLSDVISRR